MFYHRWFLAARPIAAAALACAVSAVLLLAHPAQAIIERFDPIYQFPAAQGSYPVAPPILASDGNVYGTAFTGGKYGYGVIYKVSGGKASVLHAFTGGSDGSYPRGGLVETSPGIFFGVASMGGASGFGEVFKITSAGAFTTVHSFAGYSSDGAFPNSVTRGTDGFLYGTTYSGGSGGGGSLWGTIFCVHPGGLKYQVIYNFTGGSDGGHIGGVVAEDSSHVLYTTTEEGGANFLGTVDAITQSGAETTLHSFGGSDGNYAISGVTLFNGMLYGTTELGGAYGLGVAFALPTDGSSYSDLHDFGGVGDGIYPEAPLAIGSDGNLYGTTFVGGAYSEGIVFSLTPGGVETVAHSFNYIDGASPVAGLTLGSDGDLYGAAYAGTGEGAVYKIDTSQHYTLLSSLPAPSGSSPLGGLVEVSPGVFWGTIDHGGANGAGLVYQVTSSGGFKVIHQFAFTDGAYPKCALTLFNGEYYGITRRGGTTYDLAAGNRGDGVLFRIAPGGSFQVVHNFKGPDGANPFGGLVVGSNNMLYGTTEAGGKNGKGVVFAMPTSGPMQTVHQFNGTDGNDPRGSLYLASDGSVYGTTYSGGTSGNGTIFSVTSSGVFASIYSFTGGTDGANPSGGLTQDGALLYGVASDGGSNYAGAAFSVDPTTSPATVTGIYQFQDQSDGGYPDGTLLTASDGNLYGTTTSGEGGQLFGTLFQLTTSGGFTVEYTFTGGPFDGAEPIAGLIQGSDGDLYGTTTERGGGGVGNVFRYIP